MKICILSMQNVPNFGSLLQAYSLKKILETMGHTVSFIDIEKNPEDNSYVGESVQVYANEGEKKQGFLSKVKKIDKYAFNRLAIKKLNRRQEDLFQQFRSENLKIIGGGTKINGTTIYV